MKDIRYIWRGAALSLALSLMAAGCSMTDDYVCPADDGGTPGSGSAFIQLSFGMADARGTRANPDGGEQGNGPEAGQADENKVGSAVAFLFKGTVNGDADTPVTPVYFFPVNGPEAGGNGIDAVWTTSPMQTTVDNGEYNIIVVANPGTERWWESPENQKLGKVRDHIQQEAWKETTNGDNNTSYTDFLMSSADEPTQKLTINNNPKENPATVTVNVERMAARVDYLVKNQYECEDPMYEDATVEITGATIVNRLTAGSYLLKRVANDVDVDPENPEEVDYLGDETPVAGGKATNYVLDPWTALKTQQNLTGTPFTIKGKPASAAGLYDAKTYIPTRSDNPEDWADYCKAGVDATEDDYLRVGYALENTTGRLETSLNYNTGIVFKAQFNPGSALDGYVQGHTFFRYSDRLYTSLTAMMGQLNEQADFAAYFNAAVEGLKSKTWADVTAFCDALSYDPVGLAAYFTGLQGDAQGTDAVGTALDNVTWTAFLATLGVGESDITDPQINQGGVTDTRARLYASSNGMLRTYYKGRCYYIWWLRHSNDGDDEKNGVMEYAVVRNNIYKVNVNSIYSLGGDIPDNEGLDAQVYVNKWSMLGPETLPM